VDTEIYIVLSADTEGSSGVKPVHFYGCYRGLDDAFLRFKEFLDQDKRKRHIRQLPLNAKNALETVASFQRQKEQLLADKTVLQEELEDIGGQVEVQLEEMRPGIDHMTRAEIDELIERINPNYNRTVKNISAKIDSSYQKLREVESELGATQDPDNVFVGKVDGKWVVAGGYHLHPTEDNPFWQLFDSYEVVATASYDKEYFGTHFYIIRNPLF